MNSKKNTVFTLILILTFTLLLTSCQKQNTASKDAQRYVKSIEDAAKSAKKSQLDALAPAQHIVYTGKNLRDPFEIPATAKNTKQYLDTILPHIALDNFKLVGIVLHKNAQWALFRANDGKLYKMTKGMRVGLQHALLMQIEANQVTFQIDASVESEEKPLIVVMSLQERSK